MGPNDAPLNYPQYVLKIGSHYKCFTKSRTFKIGQLLRQIFILAGSLALLPDLKSLDLLRKTHIGVLEKNKRDRKKTRRYERENRIPYSVPSSFFSITFFLCVIFLPNSY